MSKRQNSYFNSGPAPEHVTSQIYQLTKTMKEYKTVPDLTVNLSALGTSTFSVDGHEFVVEVIDCTADYVEMVKSIFDFPTIKSFVQTKRIILNAMHAGKKVHCSLII